MRTLKTIDVLAGSTCTVPCPIGKRVRIVAALMRVQNSTNNSDQLFLIYSKSGQDITEAITGMVSSALSVVTMAIGLSQTDCRETLVDPVTGVVTYDGLNTQSAPLPDIWFDYEVNLAASGQALQVLSLRVTYESDDSPAKAS